MTERMDHPRLDPKIWRHLTPGDAGLVLSLPLRFDEHQRWISPVTSQPFVAKVSADVGMLQTFHLWLVSRVTAAGVVYLESTDSSRVVAISKLPDPFCFVEFCAGLAGTSMGGMAVGFRPLSAVDHTALAFEALCRNQFPCPVLGDVADPAVWSQVHMNIDGLRCGLMAGFPCQPYSAVGYKRAFADPRSAVLLRILDASYVLQSDWLLLECTCGAGQNEQVRSLLEQYCAARSFHWCAVNLSLENSWPSKRRRWWALLLPVERQLPHLVDLPMLMKNKIGDFIQTWPQWSRDQETQLFLQPEEIEAFQKYGTDANLLDLQRPAPTLLHSLGYQVKDCVCGCRGPLSEYLLQSQGLHGLLIRSEEPPHRLRHPHPKEAAWMVAIPGIFVHNCRVREDLPLIGQVASPLQSLWVLAQWRHAEDPAFDHHDCLKGYMNFVHRTHACTWPIPLMYCRREVRIEIEEECHFTTFLDRPCTAVQLKEACRALGLEVDDLHLWQGQVILTGDMLIREGRVAFSSRLVGHGRDFLLEQQGVPCLFNRRGLDDLTILQEAKKLIQKAGRPVSQLWSPRHISTLLEMWPSAASDDIRKYLVHTDNFGFLWNQGHWICFHAVTLETKFVMTFFDGLSDELPADAEILAARFQRAAAVAELEVRKVTRIDQTHGDHCGAVALLHLGLALNLWHEADEATAELWHECLLQKQCRQGRGKEDVAVEVLTELLISKGVPRSSATSRAHAGIKKLTFAAVDRALSAKDPWRALKELGSTSSSKPFQWVQYQELMQHVQGRAATKKKADGDSVKKMPKKIPPALSLEVEDLELLPELFVDPAGDFVPVLGIKDIVSDARGVAIVSHELAGELSEHSTNLSVDALAVLTIGAMPTSKQKERDSVLQWPALYRPTSEPILVTGSLLQLGDLTIERFKQTGVPAVPQLQTEVVKLSLYKDMTDFDWVELRSGPLKFLISNVAGLQFCSGQDCNKGCQKFHPAVEESVTTMIQDAWAWRWTTNEGRICKADVAEQFGVYLRIPSSGLEALLRFSGWHGLFFEPRSDVSQGPHGAYKVIWLPRNTSLDEAQKKKRTLDAVLGLARMQAKLGLRTLAKDEGLVQKQLYPDSKVAHCVVSLLFEAGPLPFGLGRDDLAKLLAEWKWVAKPMRILRSTSTGKYWQIGAEKPPPAPLMATDQGEVTITLRSSQEIDAGPKKIIQASARTQARMKGSLPSKPVVISTEEATSSTFDPWMDAWKNYKPSHKKDEVVFAENRHRPSTEARQRMSQMQQQIHELQSHWTKGNDNADSQMPDSPTIDSSELQELRAQTKKHESWFQDTHSRISQFEGTLQQQGVQIAQLNEAMQHQTQATSSLQTQVKDISASIGDKITSCFETQATRLEALLEKRMRTS